MKVRPLSARLATVLVVVLLLPTLFATQANGQEKTAKADTQRYLILNTKKFKTLQKELDQAISAGYRVVSGDAGFSTLALEKVLDEKKYQYLVTGSLPQLEKEGKIEGYRVLPFTFSGGKWISCGAVLEKLLPGEKQPEYHVVWTVKTSTFEKEISAWAEKGFSLKAISGFGGNFALMERASGAPESGPADRYVILATTMKGTMEKELADAVARGYRLAVVAEAGDEMMFALEKRTPGEAAPEYRLATSQFTGKFENKIREAVVGGYQLLPRSLSAQDRYAVLGRAFEMVAVLEKNPNQPPIQFKFLSAKRVATLQKELTQAAEAGWSLNRLFITYKEGMILLEKR